MNAATQTLVRSLLKIVGGFFVAKGITDDSTVEIVISGTVALIGVVWGLRHRKDSPQSVRIKKVSGLVVASILALGTGCASFSSSQEQTRLDGTIVKQRQTVRTFFDAKSEIAKLRASTTDKTQGLTVGGLAEEASGTNVVDLTERVIGAAVRAAVKP